MFRLRLRGRMTLYFSCLVLGLIASTFIVVGRRAEESLQRFITDDLNTSKRVFDENLRFRYDELVARCKLLADSPRLVAAVDTRDPPTVLDIAETLQEEVDSDLFTVTDQHGMVLARTDMPELHGMDLSTLPLIRKALSREEVSAPMGQGGQLYQVASVPLYDPGGHTIIGTLSIGFRIDDRLSGRLRQQTRNEVVFLQEGQIIAASLPREVWPDVNQLVERVRRERHATSDLGDILVGQERYRGLWGTLEDVADQTVGVYVILRPLRREEKLLEDIRSLLTGLGTAGILTAVIASYLLARGLTRPIARMAEAAGRIAAGDLNIQVDVRSSDEIGHLAGDFNRMAESLQASRKDLERLNEDLEVQVAQRTEELAASLERIAVINRITNVISSSLDLEEIGRTFAQEVHRLVPFARISVLLLTEDGDSLEVMIRLNPDGSLAGGLEQGARFPMEGTSAGWVVDQGRPAIRPWLGGFRMDDLYLGEGMRSAIQFPLVSKGATLGVLNLLSADEAAYSEGTLDVLQPIVDQLAVAVEHSRLYRQEQVAVERLQEVSRLKSEFLANMSHELRTPMNSIIGFAELMQNPAFGTLAPVQSDHIDTILRNARHLLQLINDILDLSKIEAGKLEFNYKPFEVPSALEDAQVLIRSLAAKKGLQMSCTVPEAPLTIVSDETKFKQIMYNLLSNAVKFTPQGGRIDIRARVTGHESPVPSPKTTDAEDGESATRDPRPVTSGDGRWVEVSVEDTGIGIRAGDQDRIFNAFEQVDGSFARHYEGTGLGLALTRRLVELQGGRIWVDSEVDRGSKFTFLLPMERPA